MATPDPAVAGTPEAPPTDRRPKARWTWLATLGLVLAGLGPVMMFLAGMLWGLAIDDEVGFFIGTAGLAIVGAAMVARFGTWAKVVGAVAAFLVAGALFWTAFGLAAPNSFFDFMPGVLVIPGALTAMVACIAAIVAGRRGHTSSRPVGGERTAIRVVLGVVLAAALVSGVLTLTGSSEATGGDVEVAATDFVFEPQSLEVAPGESILVRNDDPFLHTFTIDDLDIDEALNPGSSVLIEVAEGSGTYTFYCRPHTGTPDEPTEDDMAGELTIR